jgi:hypothetical protein
MSGPVAAGVWGRRVPAGGIPILAAIDPTSAVSIFILSSELLPYVTFATAQSAKLKKSRMRNIASSC